MASFTQSRIGRRAAKTISARILTGIVRVLDFTLLLIAAFLAAIGVGSWFQAPLRGLLALAATIGAGTGCIVLASQGVYALDRFRAPWAYPARHGVNTNDYRVNVGNELLHLAYRK